MRWSKENYIVIIFLILHLVGALALMVENLKPIFLFLTPFNLIISFILLIWGNMNFSLRFIKVVSLLFLVGFFIEVAGVQTALLFGNYSYGKTLGFMYLNVPIIIGLNWVMLVLSCYAVSTYFTSNSILQLLLSSSLMVLLDTMIEPVAIQLDFWQWEGGNIPLQNYVMWFVVALFMNWIISFNKLYLNIKLGFGLLISQVLFFTIQSLSLQ